MLKSLQMYNKNLTLPNFTLNFAYAAFFLFIYIIYHTQKEKAAESKKMPCCFFTYTCVRIYDLYPQVETCVIYSLVVQDFIASKLSIVYSYAV